MSRQMSKAKQDEKIEEIRQRYLEVFSQISEDKKELAKTLIDRVAFMSITLDLLEDDIKTKGPTYPFEQGKQKMIVENPAQKSYNTMINRYTATVRQLSDLLPKIEEVVDDGFDDFMKRAEEK